MEFQEMEGARKSSTIYQSDDGHQYSLRLDRRHKKYVKCLYQNKNGTNCHGTAVIEGGLLHNRAAHCHAPFELDTEMRRMIGDMRQRVRAGQGDPAEIFAEIAEGEAGAALQWRNVRQMMARTQRAQHPRAPQTAAECAAAIPEAAPATRINHSFNVLLPAGQVAVAFAARDVLEAVDQGAFIELDATFRVVPRLFQQLLVLFVDVGGRMLPAFHVLMTSKTRALYEAVLAEVAQRLPAPATCMADWEAGMRTAVQETWPHIQVQGCWFHYTQAVVRQIRRLGLHREYREANSPFTRWARKLLVVPLVPAHLVPAAWALLIDQELPWLDPNMAALRRYMNRQWRPLAPATISVHGADRRTNNNSESYFSRLASTCRVAHLPFWRLLAKLNLCIKRASRDARAARLGEVPPPRQGGTQRLLQRLAEEVAEGRRTLDGYLDAVKHHLRHRVAVMEEAQEVPPVAPGGDMADEPEVAANAGEIGQPILLVDPQAPAQAQEEEVEAGGNACGVCLVPWIQAGVRAVIVPCFHAGACMECAGRLLREGHRCPFCRGAMENVHAVYM